MNISSDIPKNLILKVSDNIFGIERRGRGRIKRESHERGEIEKEGEGEGRGTKWEGSREGRESIKFG